MMTDFSVECDLRGELPAHRTITGNDVSVNPQVRTPRPYPIRRFVWNPEKDIGRIPAVSAREFGSPTRMSPSIVNDVNCRGSTELKMQTKIREIESSPSPKSRRDSLRLSSPFFVQRARETIASNLGLIQRRLRQR